MDIFLTSFKLFFQAIFSIEFSEVVFDFCFFFNSLAYSAQSFCVALSLLHTCESKI